MNSTKALLISTQAVAPASYSMWKFPPESL